MKQILCYGDSNTWGLIPGTSERYPWGVRWTSLLQELMQNRDICILEEGLCGRTTVYEDAFRENRNGMKTLPLILETHAPVDAAVLMLGTNDCKTLYHASAQTIGKGISLCIDALKQAVPAENILLVSPPLLGDDVWKPEKDPEFDIASVQTCRQLKEVYRTIAQTQGIGFLAASDVTEPSPLDDEHMTATGHEKLAHAICEKLAEMKFV